jgi:hypothetical protein
MEILGFSDGEVFSKHELRFSRIAYAFYVV